MGFIRVESVISHFRVHISESISLTLFPVALEGKNTVQPILHEKFVSCNIELPIEDKTPLRCAFKN